MEPVDPVRDFLTTRGTLRKATLQVYDSTKDVPGGNPFAAAIPIRGSRGAKKVGMQGSVTIATTTWMIAGQTADQVLQRPALKSKIVNAGETWAIDSITTNPRNGRLFDCQCTLIPGG